MLKRSFINLASPRLDYRPFAAIPNEPEPVVPRQTVTLFHRGLYEQTGSVSIKTGDAVKTGQKLSLFADSDAYIISPVTGTVTDIAPHAGDFGESFAAVTIDIAPEEEFDTEFSDRAAAPGIDIARGFLRFAPGSPSLDVFADPDRPIDTLVVSGMDPDLLVATQQYVIRTDADGLKAGIRLIREMTGVGRVLAALPGDIVQNIGSIGAEVIGIDPVYPSGIPRLIANRVLGEPVPAGKQIEEMGVTVMSAEAVATLGRAFETRQIPVTKYLTLIKKDGEKEMVSARIGTPVGDILAAHGVTLQDRDRLILGGPMTGSAVFSEAHPIGPDTDAIMIQDHGDLPMVSNSACINCGECNRGCPVNIQVNMLVRFLEAGQYEEGADLYDLHCCVDCGFCSFVCVAKIPIFQYIRLAKYELGRMQSAEAENA
jgi:Na+-translocating ferredoxin:NAD+ oxidoreductase subunit C